MSEKLRADLMLVQQQLCESRERAQAAIMEGRVFLGDRRINKPSEMIDTKDSLHLKTAETEYVSRGALKLEKAIRVFHADLRDKVIMDIGSSTGGFTDVCLRNGAKRVYSIDVGYGQLDWKLRNDARVTVMERTNARYLQADMFPEKPTVTVMDVSFISIRLIIPAADQIMGDGGVFYTLIKPQFEAGREAVGKNGVVRNAGTHEKVLLSLNEYMQTAGLRITALDYSPITGPKGNIEFLAKIQHEDQADSITDEHIRNVVSEAHQKMNLS